MTSTTNNEMSDTSLHNLFWNEPSDYIGNIFENLVIKPFTQYPKNEAWQREVVNSYNNKNFDNIKAIVGRGQANFDEPFNELTPSERVLLYCYDNMYQHIISQIYIFNKHKNIFDKYIFDSQTKILFIDFGCGPLSSGLALAMYYAKSAKSNGQFIKVNYIGLDKAESMLKKAREFSQYSNLFHSNTSRLNNRKSNIAILFYL
ncbi:hypothetical protein WA1_34485 [Scytonema hofmannii PCC 7110]|uniref:Methyltransferase domain-containing protein n=1 Tax=Scytonema hofmannii PCC 7110 TaxID=128403 RepID=A0A139X362_9CYAN|nr:hypothetical protein [Scytonema hofmannii]KYC39093.1 hypothetical protein WA1_34485 [Scytonema hofmannii PCC 7110]